MNGLAGGGSRRRSREVSSAQHRSAAAREGEVRDGRVWGRGLAAVLVGRVCVCQGPEQDVTATRREPCW